MRAAAWVSSLGPSLSSLTRARTRPPPPRCSAASQPPSPSSSTPLEQPPPPDKDTVALAVAASLVLSSPTPASIAARALSPDALAAYCAAKGAHDAAEYAAAARAAREPWDGSGAASARARLLHAVCNGEGDATYADPETGYTVFAAVAHLRRGRCCGIPEGGGLVDRTHRCRHCPYAPDGRLTSGAYRRLKGRIPLLDAVCKGTAGMYGAGAQAAAAAAAQTDGVVREAGADEVEGGMEEDVCAECAGRGHARCRRCNGYAFLVSPEPMLCPQCDATGGHQCMTCTAWTPPQRIDFDS